MPVAFGVNAIGTLRICNRHYAEVIVLFFDKSNIVKAEVCSCFHSILIKVT